MMTTNQIRGLRAGGGAVCCGFGLGFGVVTDPSGSSYPLSQGAVMWPGGSGTLFWIDPAEDLVGIVMVQVNPYPNDILRRVPAVVSQAVVDGQVKR